jgi:hypothetical protein
MTAARNDSRKPLEYLAGKEIDLVAITGEGVPPPYPRNYDWQELLIHIIIIAASVVPAFVVWLLFCHR